jgi:hypothetical protein
MSIINFDNNAVAEINLAKNKSFPSPKMIEHYSKEIEEQMQGLYSRLPEKSRRLSVLLIIVIIAICDAYSVLKQKQSYRKNIFDVQPLTIVSE